MIWTFFVDLNSSPPGGACPGPITVCLVWGTCPRDDPEPPTASDCHRQQLVNMPPACALTVRPTHENTLVMCTSLVVSRPRAPRWRQPSCATADDVPAACR